MKRLVSMLCAAALLAPVASQGLAAPASSTDLTFPTSKVTGLTMRARHQPYWALLAQCAGVFGAAAQFEGGRGDAALSARYERTGTSMMREAMHRLQVDRGLSEKDSLAVAAQQVYVGRDQGAELLKGGTADYSTFNLKRSACMDIDDVYHMQRAP